MTAAAVKPSRDEFRALARDYTVVPVWREVLAEAKASGYLAPAVAEDVQRFIDNPARWSLDHGGIGAFPRGA